MRKIVLIAAAAGAALALSACSKKDEPAAEATESRFGSFGCCHGCRWCRFGSHCCCFGSRWRRF